MGFFKNWIKIKIFQFMVWVSVNLLGAKVSMNQNIIENQQEPEFGSPCEMCRDHVMIGGISMHISQLKTIEDEWVSRGLIR